MKGEMGTKLSATERVAQSSTSGHAPYGGVGEAIVGAPAGRGKPERRYEVSRTDGQPDEADPASRSVITMTGPEPARAPTGIRHRIRLTLALIRSNPTGRIALKVLVGVVGALVVAVGVALIPLPGPGWLIVIAGLAIWGVEFHWAKRLLAFTRRHVQGWTKWVGRQTWPIRLVIGAVGLVFVGTVAATSLRYGLGIDVIASFLRYLATN